MKIYNLCEERLELISAAIVKITQICKNVEEIDTIYMIKFHQVVAEKEMPTIKIVPIYTEINFGRRNKTLIENLIGKNNSKKLESIIKNVKEKTGIKISIVPSSHYDYSLFSMDIKYLEDLYNGKILFDRNGKYTDMKNKLDNIFSSKDIYSNTIEFKPALTLIKTN